jgi:VanZ family protein
MKDFLRSWWPALVWACVIFTLSTNSFSSGHTAAFFGYLFKWFLPWLTASQLDLLNEVLRKSAHFTVYFIFYLCLFRAVRGNRQGWRWSWALTALAIAAGYSVFDEIHQIFVPSRTASPWDSLRDSTGALLAALFLWLLFRLRGSKPQPYSTGISESPSGSS